MLGKKSEETEVLSIVISFTLMSIILVLFFWNDFLTPTGTCMSVYALKMRGNDVSERATGSCLVILSHIISQKLVFNSAKPAMRYMV